MSYNFKDDQFKPKEWNTSLPGFQPPKSQYTSEFHMCFMPNRVSDASLLEDDVK
jgi:hypothetical protein